MVVQNLLPHGGFSTNTHRRQDVQLCTILSYDYCAGIHYMRKRRKDFWWGAVIVGIDALLSAISWVVSVRAIS